MASAKQNSETGTWDLYDVEVFRAGKYGDSKEATYTDADLAELARTYNPALIEAPVKLDHTEEGPAAGWIARLRAVGSLLLADLRDMEDWVVYGMQRGSWKKRSIEIMAAGLWPEIPGRYVVGLALIGASNPRVPGLADVFSTKGKQVDRFSGAFDPLTSLKESAMTPDEKTAFDALAADVAKFKAENEGLKTQLSTANSNPKVAALETQVQELTAKFTAADSLAKTKADELAATQARLASIETERAVEVAVAKFDAAFAKANSEGRVTRTEREALQADYLDLPSGNSVKFGTDQTGSSRDRFLFNLSQRPVLVSTKQEPETEAAKKKTGAVDPSDKESFSQAIHDKASELMKANGKLAYIDACAEAEKALLATV